MCPSSCPPAHCAGTGTPQPSTDPPPAAPSQETQLQGGMYGVKVGWGGGGWGLGSPALLERFTHRLPVASSTRGRLQKQW